MSGRMIGDGSDVWADAWVVASMGAWFRVYGSVQRLAFWALASRKAIQVGTMLRLALNTQSAT
jgi:hypothetical protein